MKSKDIIKLMEDDGWYWVKTRGSHNYYKHKTKSGKVTVPHPKKDIPIKTVNSIMKQAQL